MVIFKKLYFFNTIKKKNKLGSTNITRKKQQREEKRIIHDQEWGKFSQWRSKTIVAVVITTRY